MDSNCARGALDGLASEPEQSDLVTCRCFARANEDVEPERYQCRPNVLFGIWPACPAHGWNYISPVWTRWHGRIERDEAATEESVAAQ